MKFRLLIIAGAVAVVAVLGLRFYQASKGRQDRILPAAPAAPAVASSSPSPSPEIDPAPEPDAPTPSPSPEPAAESAPEVSPPPAEETGIGAEPDGRVEAAPPAADDAPDTPTAPTAGDAITSASEPPSAPVAETELAAPASRRAPPVYSEDWPRFLGPDATGVSRELDLNLDWPEEGPPELWRRELGAAYSAPVAQGDRLVLFHRLGDEEILECVQPLTGETIWRYGYPTQYVDSFGFNGGPRSSPAIDDDRVYSFGAEGMLSCVDLETGTLRWQRNLNEEYGVPQNFFGVGTSPVIEGNLVLLNLGGPQGAGVIALNKTLGATVWTSTSEGASYSTPIVRTVREQRLAIFFTREGLLVLDPQSGAERYRYEFRSRNEASVNAATPVIVGDVVFLSASYNVGAVALRLGETGVAAIWKDPRAMSNHWATSIYAGGYLYGMDGRHESGSNFRCIDFQTGAVRWTADQGLGRASFLMAEGHLIALGERGELALIEVNPERYIEKRRIQAMDYPCWTPPILARGLLFLRSETQIACFDLRRGAS